MFDVVFLIPGPGNIPIGGHKIVYEYANRLTNKNFKVAVIHSARSNRPNSYRGILRSYASYIHKKLFNRYTPKWFNLNIDISLYWFHYMNVNIIPESRVYVATAWDTAKVVHSIPRKHSKKIYLIQGYEDWSATDQELAQTYNYGLQNIAISEWIKKVVESTGASCSYLPNGIDGTEFYLENDPRTRLSNTICTFHHKQDFKGYARTIEVLERVRLSFPELKLKIFGTNNQPSNIPSWASYYYLPNRGELRQIYNSSSIFVSSSEKEGWGLTLCEAMQCGCAIVATDIDGHREFCVDKYNSLLSPIKNVFDMSENIKQLINDDEMRANIVDFGLSTARKLTWDESVERFIKFGAL